MLRQQDLVGPDRPGGALLGRVCLGLTAAVVLTQIAYPLTEGLLLHRLTVLVVVLFATTSLVHAWASRGAAWAVALVVLAAGGGLLAEAIGVRTGMPFGRYRYADTLGPGIAGVPLVVPLAWLMMAYPSLLLGRTLTARLSQARRAWALGRSGSRGRQSPRAARTLPVALAGGLTLATWDLFLDPQMVAAGHWRWTYPTPALPGMTGVPVTNLLGWLLVGVLMVGLLHVCLPDRSARTVYAVQRTSPGRPQGHTGHRRTHLGRSDLVPGVLLGWTWAGSTLANAAFFDRPAVAWWGGVAMGALVLPYLLILWGRRP